MNRKRVGRWVITSVALLAALLVTAGALTSLYTEHLWFASVGFIEVFWSRTLWEWGTRILSGVLVGLFVFFNLRLVSSSLGVLHIRRKFGNLEISERLPESYVTWTVVFSAILIGLWFGAGVPAAAGLDLLYMVRAVEWGVRDPILGHDLSYYVFTLPVLAEFVTLSLVLVILTVGVTAVGYATTGALRISSQEFSVSKDARIHMAALATLALVIVGVRFFLARGLLLLDGSSDVAGIFGFADAEARLPGLQALGILSILLAGLVLWSGIRARRNALLIGMAGYVVALVVLANIYPGIVQRFRVQPNELQRETPYIDWNLEYTRMGFGLDRIQRRDFGYERPNASTWSAAEAQFSGLPVWNASTLLTTFREREARFRYYDFNQVSIDRYEAPDGRIVPIAVSVREVDPTGIEDPNWQNLHLRERYLTGMGAVASVATRRTDDGGPPMIVSAIPPEFTPSDLASEDLRLERDAVYFGTRPQPYAILTPSDSAFLDPQGRPGTAGVDFPEGIPLTSLLRTLAFSWRFSDANLVFASEINDSSRLVFRREIEERVRMVAPFLSFHEEPYPVIHEGRVVWILDGFTLTRAFPLSAVYGIDLRTGVSYVRNSVKVTIDGVTGDLGFYAVDPEDRLLQSYRQAFPGLIRDFEEMPDGLQAHIRYPDVLLDLQGTVLTQYHQETAPIFHGQQDVWSLAQEQAEGTSPVPYRPEYGHWTLPGDTEPSFLVSTVFVPAGRQNLTAILVGRSDPDRYGELILYDISVQDQVPGPRQVEALVEQDPEISQQFSLWRQGGSQVWTGHLHLVPAGSTLLYMEPVYLAAEVDAIPELSQFVVSDGTRVAMEPTLAGALARIAGSAAGLTRDSVPLDPTAAEPGEAWPQEALDLLDLAEERARAGDWSGFGEALDALRLLLEQLSSGGG